MIYRNVTFEGQGLEHVCKEEDDGTSVFLQKK